MDVFTTFKFDKITCQSIVDFILYQIYNYFQLINLNIEK